MVDDDPNQAARDAAIAIASGETVESIRRKRRLLLRLQEASERYVGLPPTEWPSISFNWDTTRASQRFSLDGCSAGRFAQLYPDGLTIGEVDLPDLDAALCHFDRREEEELWEVGCENKLAYMVAYLHESEAISPPIVSPTLDGEVALGGGNHRYAVAKALAVPRIPILADPSHRDALVKLIPIIWQEL